jgi:cytochrome bd ubiquinol oxidase subunit II
VLFFWFLVVLASLLAYVLLDGYDLGIGVLTLFQPEAADRRRMAQVVGNVWDGNESWLILLAMGLLAGMPDAYATALPALYLPLLTMIFALVFRGVAVEMALRRPVADRTWIRLFGIGSLVAAFAQGVLFGGLMCGVTVRDELFAGGTWDFLGHGYALLTGLVTVALFTLAGAARLQAKTDGALRGRMGALVRPAL